MIAYRPLGHGKLARRSHDFICEICADRKTGYAQVALSWLLSRSAVNFPIPRASRVCHVKEDAQAGDVILSAEEMKRLDSL